MSLEAKIEKDLKEAMIKKEESLVSVLRLIRSAVHNEAIAKKKKKLSDDEVLKIISTQAKKRREAIEAFTKGNRDDMANKEKQELEIIQKYLPEQLSREAIKRIVQEIVGQMGDEKQFGKVMGQVMARVKGQADGQMVNKIVKEQLEA